MPSLSKLVVCGSCFCISFIICSLLLPRTLQDYCKKKRKMQDSIKRTVGLSLVTMSFFTCSLFLYVVHIIILVAAGIDMWALELLNNLLYFIAVLMSLYVWIRRLSDAFEKSAHAYSVKYIRNLRIFYFGTLAFGLIVLLQHFIANILNLTKIISIIGGAFFMILFVSLFIIVLYSFIHKMKQSIKISEQVAQNTAHQTHSIKPKLVQLIVKFTILAVFCIGSTLCTLMLVLCILSFASGAGYWLQLPIAIDCLIGFMSLYCAWSNHKDMYRKVFGCVHSVIIQHREESSVTGPDFDGGTREMAPSVASVRSQTQLSNLPSSSVDIVTPASPESV
eukprot:455217_1